MTKISILVLIGIVRTAAGFLPSTQRCPSRRSIQRGIATCTSKDYGFVTSFSRKHPSRITDALFASPSESTERNTNTAEFFSTLPLVELKKLLREKGATVSGKKQQLVQRLTALHNPQAQIQTDTDTNTKTKKQTKVNKAKPKKAASSAKSKDTSSSDKEKVSTGIENGFSSIGVPPEVVQRLDKMGLSTPTPIQKEAIPHALSGRDVMGLAQTGTGKTLAFGVPLVAQMMANKSGQARKRKPKSVLGLVLAPTRELAHQIAGQLRALTENTSINTYEVVGGVSIGPQINKLKQGTDLLVATPGRLIDLADRKALSLTGTTFLVLDEADMMLDMGFLPALKKIRGMLPPKIQTMCFSATMAKNMNEVANTYLNKPVRVEVARAGKTADKVTQELHYIAKTNKSLKLLGLLANHREDRSVVFGRTKHGVEKLSQKICDAGFKAVSIHGNKSQSQRNKALAGFKSGKVKVLVATDVAARGLDIPDVKYVYNYELPNIPEAYVHRIGRTARAGKEGAAIAFCSMEEMDDLMNIQKVTGIKIPVVSGKQWTRQEAYLAKGKTLQKLSDQKNASQKKKKKIKVVTKQRAPVGGRRKQNTVNRNLLVGGGRRDNKQSFEQAYEDMFNDADADYSDLFD